MSSGELTLQNAPVAQLDRAPDFESGGQGLKSLPARHWSARSFERRTVSKTMLPLIAVLLASVSAARAQDPAVHGRALLKEFCSCCHAIGKTGNSPNRVAPSFVPSAASWISMSFSAACSAASHQAIPPCRNSNSTRTMPARSQPTCGRSSNNDRRAAHELNLALAGFACHGIAEHGGFDQRRHLHIALRHHSVAGADADQRLIPCRP